MEHKSFQGVTVMPAPGSRSKVLKPLLMLLAGGAILAVSYPFLALAGILVRDSWQTWQRCRGYTQFTPQAWQDETLMYDPRYVRLCMVEDLLAQEILMGRSRSEVMALLGEPDPPNGFQEYDLIYILGPERSFISIDYEWLVINFDPQGTVRTARLITD